MPLTRDALLATRRFKGRCGREATAALRRPLCVAFGFAELPEHGAALLHTGAAPTARLREYIELLRAICATFQHGAGSDYRHDHYRFTHMQPLFNPGPTAPLLPQSSLPDCRLLPGTLVTTGRHGAAMAGTPGCAAPPAPAKMTDELDDE